MKRKLKNRLMILLITALCAVLFADYSWAGSGTVYHKKRLYDTNFRNIGLVLNVRGGHYGSYPGYVYGYYGYYGYGYTHHYRGYRYNKKDYYYRHRYRHKRNNYRYRYGRHLKHGFRKHHNDGDKNYEKNSEYAYEHNNKTHESSRASGENHKEKIKGKENWFQ